MTFFPASGIWWGCEAGYRAGLQGSHKGVSGSAFPAHQQPLANRMPAASHFCIPQERGGKTPQGAHDAQERRVRGVQGSISGNSSARRSSPEAQSAPMTDLGTPLCHEGQAPFSIESQVIEVHRQRAQILMKHRRHVSLRYAVRRRYL